MQFPTLSTALAALDQVTSQVRTEQLSLPTPCPEWTVAQVLMHAAGDQHAWAASVGSGNPPTYNPFEPPTVGIQEVGDAVNTATEAARTSWAEIAEGSETLDTPLPPVPELSPELAAGAAALDAAIHAWDVAIATGQPSPLTDELAEQLRPAAEATVESLRGFAYGPALEPDQDEGSADSLLRYLGRNPQWA